MGLLFSLFTVIALIVIVFIGVQAANLHYLFGIIFPYAALLTFIVGIVFRVIKWGRIPVPFRIPTTTGQQKSLPWIKYSKTDNPFTGLGVLIRMALEVLVFRSLFRNTKTELNEGPHLSYGSTKWLWLGGLAFHWTFLIILTRHLRLFFEPVPWFIEILETLDGFFQVGAPVVYITNIIFLAAVTFLFLRRVIIPQMRYISLAADYFPLLLIFAIGASGVLMRYFFKTDIVGVKELTMGLVTLKPVVPQGIDIIFYIHLFLISVLFAYFPMSKLMHMAGVFLSPTRNLANNNRYKRHVNPWDYPVKIHTYEEYEEEFRDKMKSAGLPLEKE
ncbi:MAG: sulfate reduction electron transfer complex DsrMKJOP subunit DsrM [Nitrospirae bacterium]|jgi:nitrate reductase gamma subunit|nr:sulfate reduction electron transfer complex DsrMKJOP subunit DsrM [Nitrospirota bacterium]